MEHVKDWNGLETILRYSNPKERKSFVDEFTQKYLQFAFQQEFSEIHSVDQLPKRFQHLNLNKNISHIALTPDKKYIGIDSQFFNEPSTEPVYTRDSGNLDQILLLTNSDNTELLQTKKNLTLITREQLSYLDSDNIKEIYTGEHEFYSPKKHQEEAIAASVKGLKKSDRGKIISPCGSGKTLTALWTKEEMDPRHTLVMVPSLALMNQIVNDWRSQQKEFNDYICICSDNQVDENNEAYRKNISQIHAPGRITTDADEIKKFLRKKGKKIVFSTYQSSPQLTEALTGSNFSFDLGILDEAHKTTGRADTLFSTVLFDENIPIKKRLFYTATPKVRKVRKKRDTEEEIIAEMNDPELYGKEFYSMYFAEAIKRGILIDYKIIAMGVSDEDLQGKIKEGDPNFKEVLNNFALQKAMEKYGFKHTISYHSSIKKANDFKKRHKELFDFSNIYHVNGKQKTHVRNKYVDRFINSGSSILTNSQCLNEGIDIPIVDSIFYADAKKSKIAIVQSAGRALRLDPNNGKQRGYIVVPVYHDSDETLDEAVESGKFKNLVTVLKAMADVDERIVDLVKIKGKSEDRGNGEKKGEGKDMGPTGHLPDIVDIGDLVDRFDDDIFDSVIKDSIDYWLTYEEHKKIVHERKVVSNIQYKKEHAKGNLPKGCYASVRKIYSRLGYIAEDFFWQPKAKDYLDLVQKKKISSRRHFIKEYKAGNLPEWVTRGTPDRKFAEFKGGKGWYKPTENELLQKYLILIQERKIINGEHFRREYKAGNLPNWIITGSPSQKFNELKGGGQGWYKAEDELMQKYLALVQKKKITDGGHFRREYRAGNLPKWVTTGTPNKRFNEFKGGRGWYKPKITVQDYLNLIQKKKITSRRHFRREYRAGDLPEWVTIGTPDTKFAEFKGGKGWYRPHSKGSLDDYKKLIQEKKITSGNHFRREYKAGNLPDWVTTGYIYEKFDELKEGKECYISTNKKTVQDYQELIKKRKIISGQQFRREYAAGNLPNWVTTGQLANKFDEFKGSDVWYKANKKK